VEFVGCWRVERMNYFVNWILLRKRGGILYSYWRAGVRVVLVASSANLMSWFWTRSRKNESSFKDVCIQYGPVIEDFSNRSFVES